MPEQNNITNSLAQGKYPWGQIQVFDCKWQVHVKAMG